MEYGKEVSEVIKTDDMSFLKSIFTHSSNFGIDYVKTMKPQLLLELIQYSNYALNSLKKTNENAFINPIVDEIKKELTQSEYNTELIDLLDNLYDSFEEKPENKA